MPNLRRLVVGSAIFIVLLGMVSATNALTRQPFEWITTSQAAQATALYVWASFCFVVFGLWRRNA